jgi:hypothetical protein
LGYSKTESQLLLSRSRHPLAKTTFFDEIALEATNLLIEQIICLVDQTDGYVRHDFERSSFTELSI